MQEFPTTVRGLVTLADWIAAHAVKTVMMDYREPFGLEVPVG